MEVLDWPLSKILTYAECLSDDRQAQMPDVDFEAMVEKSPAPDDLPVHSPGSVRTRTAAVESYLVVNHSA